LLAEYPAQCVHDIALAAAVRADQGSYPLAELKPRAVGKRLETGKLKALEPRGGSPPAGGK
jgi:hypothetical protein